MTVETQVKTSLTERINRIEISATLAVVNEADRMRLAGADLVDFGAGEPHFNTPQHVKDAAIAAIQANFSKYTPVGGTAELRDAIIKRHAQDFLDGGDSVLYFNQTGPAKADHSGLSRFFLDVDGRAAGEDVGAGEAEMGQSCDRGVPHDAPVVEDFLELLRVFG